MQRIDQAPPIDEQTARRIIAAILDVSPVETMITKAHERHERLLQRMGLGSPYDILKNSPRANTTGE